MALRHNTLVWLAERMKCRIGNVKLSSWVTATAALLLNRLVSALRTELCDYGPMHPNRLTRISKALVQSKMSQDDREYSLAANTQGVIFLGTPHNGSTMSIWGLRLAKSLSFLGSNPALLAGLIPGCDLLKDLHQDFIKAVGDRLHIVNFFEEVKTRLFKRFWLQKDEYVGRH